MMRKGIPLVLCAWLLGLPAAGAAATPDAGTQNPLELGAGARALALSGAYSAAADDVTALVWNSAGLARMDQIQVAAMHINLFYDTPYDFVGLAYPLLDWGTFALGAMRLATGGIILRDERSYLVGASEGNYELREFLLGYGRELPWGFALGTAVKIDQQRLLGNFTAGVGLDLGVQYRFPKELAQTLGVGLAWDQLVLGVQAQNVVGSRLRLDQETDILPLNVSPGLAYTLDLHDGLKQKILLVGGMEKSTWRAWRWRAGLEYRIYDLLALRGGFQSDAWTAGAGLSYAGLEVDYALAGQELGLSHRFSLAYRFGPSVSEQLRERERRRQEELDREAERRAQAAVAKAREEMESELKNSEQRYRRERRALLANQERLLSRQKNRLAQEHRTELDREYFKALHYFLGIKDYLAKRYRQALTEFETVAKFDPQYMELPYYLARARQMATGQATVMSEASLQLYYQGIDLYIENDFAQAIAVWKKILQQEPNNLMVLRNIEEAQGRLDALQSAEAQGEIQPGAAPSAPEEKR